MSAIRRPGAASATVLVGLATSLVVAHAAAPDWSRRAGLDVWNVAAVEQERRAAAEQQDEVEARGERAARRREMANGLATHLAAGTLNLGRATDEVRELFADDPGITVSLSVSYPGMPTERLLFARHMIERTSRLLDDSPRSAFTRARLEAEYREMAAAPESPAAP